MADNHQFSASRHICATRHLVPFGTRLRVVNDENGAESWCIVEDYGPAAWTGRILDVSPPVRNDLRFSGVTRVRIYREVPAPARRPSRLCRGNTCGLFMLCLPPSPCIPDR